MKYGPFIFIFLVLIRLPRMRHLGLKPLQILLGVLFVRFKEFEGVKYPILCVGCNLYHHDSLGRSLFGLFSCLN